MIQNQSGRFPKKWDKSGEVVETKGNEQYAVKVAGSGRVTLRNRRFLRKHELHSDQAGRWRFAPHPHESGTLPQSPTTRTIEELAETPQPLPAPPPTQSSGPGSSQHCAPSYAPQQSPNSPVSSGPNALQQRASDRAETPQQLLALPATQSSGPAPATENNTQTRPTRVRRQRQLYDASTGKYGARQVVSDDI
jgi:hypothetical protein